MDNTSTFQQYLEWWLSAYCSNRLALNTVKGYENIIRQHIEPYIGDLRLDGIKPYDLLNLYALLASKGLSGTSVLYVHRTIHKSLNTAVKMLIIPLNIADCVEVPRKSRYRGQAFSYNQVQQLLAAAKKTEIYTAVLLAVGLGLRRGEVLGLMWSDFDLNRGTLAITRSMNKYSKEGIVFSDVKTEKSFRTLLLPDTVYNHIRTLKNTGTSLVVRSDGSIITPSILQYSFKRLLSSAGLPSIRFHDLRHTFATLAIQNGVPAKVISEYLGHSNISITMDTYGHLMIDMQRSIVTAADTFLTV